MDEFETTQGCHKHEYELITGVQQKTNVIKWCLGSSEEEICDYEAQISKLRKSREPSVKRYQLEKRVKKVMRGMKQVNYKLLRL